MVQRAVMLSRAGQCGLDTAKAGLRDVLAVATMDRSANYEHADQSESSMNNASTLKLHGLPYDYASFLNNDLPTCCCTCNASLTYPLQPEPNHYRMFMWHSGSPIWEDVGVTEDAYKHTRWSSDL